MWDSRVCNPLTAVKFYLSTTWLSVRGWLENSLNQERIHAERFSHSKCSCLKLEINEFRHYEVKIVESEKAGSHQESNPGHLWLEPLVLYHVCGRCLSLSTHAWSVRQINFYYTKWPQSRTGEQVNRWSPITSGQVISIAGDEHVISYSKWISNSDICYRRWTGDLLLHQVNRWFHTTGDFLHV